MTKKKKEPGIKMSVPEGMKFNTPYSFDTTAHSKYYYDFDRNGSHLSFDERLDVEVKAITDLLKNIQRLQTITRKMTFANYSKKNLKLTKW